MGQLLLVQYFVCHETVCTLYQVYHLIIHVSRYGIVNGNWVWTFLHWTCSFNLSETFGTLMMQVFNDRIQRITRL